MKNLFVNWSFNFRNKYHNLDHYHQLKIKYGLEVMYHFFTKLFVILLISYFFNSLINNIILCVFYLVLRIFAHGIHLKNNKYCWIMSISLFILVSLLFKMLVFNKLSTIILIILAYVSFILWAPSDTKAAPLIHKKDRIRLKLLSIISLTIEIVLSSIFAQLRTIIMLSIIIEMFNINPFIYKLTGSPRNNYINYSTR